MRCALFVLLALLALPALLASRLDAQEGTLDVVDGETLYDGGSLFTLGYRFDRREQLLAGSRHVADPLHRRVTEQRVELSAHYGLRHDVQLSFILPYVREELVQDDASRPHRVAAQGLGDASLLVKWRCLRWDAPSRALNAAVLGGVELPTGADDATDHGQLVDWDLQPGSGSWDPLLGAAVTYEPARWRFNVASLHTFEGEGRGGHRFGDRTFVELAAGNRFWLEPYPGPFMRADLLLRYRHEQPEHGGGTLFAGGSDLWTVGLNWAFRPRPELDLQLSVELPLYEHVESTQLGHEISLSLNVGLRF